MRAPADKSTPSRAPKATPSERSGAVPQGTAALQLKAALQGRSYDEQVQLLSPGPEGDAARADIHQKAQGGLAGGGGAMPHREAIQRSFGGYDVSNIIAHTDASAKDATASMGADAYATGDHIVLGDKGQSLHTVAHEAAHVIQQRSGVSLSGGVGKAGDPYEQHADAVADLVVQGKSAEGLLGEMAGGCASTSLQLKPSDGSATTRTTETETTRRETSEESVSEESEETVVRLALSQKLAEFESCASEAECADLLHDVARELGCSPRIVRMLWRQTDAGMAWTRRQRKSRKTKTRQTKEKTDTTETTTKSEADETASLCSAYDMSRIPTDASIIALQVQTRVMIDKIRDHVGFKSAMDVIQNTMSFANEFDATPRFNEAVGQAVFGGLRTSIKRGALALSTGPGKAVGQLIFSTVDAIVTERTRALSARSDMKVRNILNEAIFDETTQLDKSLGELVAGEEFISSVRPYIESEITLRCANGEHLPDVSIAVTQMVVDNINNAFGLTGLTISQDRMRDALKTLIVAMTHEGHIDHGNVSISATRRGDGYVLGNPKVENSPPILRVGARSGAIADAITQYIARFGGSINMLRIEKRIKITVNFNDIGDPFFGYFMDGSGRWIEEGKAGDASIHPVHNLKMRPHGSLEPLHFETWRQAKNMVGPFLERHKVMGDS